MVMTTIIKINHLKPKQHIMIHYPNLINKIGPLKKLYGMRNESKHRELLRYTNVTYNRQNLPLSIITKEALKYGNRLFQKRGFNSNYYSDVKYAKNIEPCLMKYFTQIVNILKITPADSMKLITQLQFKQILYKIDSIIFQKRLLEFELFKILYIVAVNDNCYYIIGEKLDTTFNEHFQCFIINSTVNEINILNFVEIKFIPKAIQKMSNGKLAVRVPQIL